MQYPTAYTKQPTEVVCHYCGTNYHTSHCPLCRRKPLDLSGKHVTELVSRPVRTVISIQFNIGKSVTIHIKHDKTTMVHTGVIKQESTTHYLVEHEWFAKQSKNVVSTIQ